MGSKMTEQERIWLMLGYLSCWHFIQLHPELRETMIDDIDNHRIRISSYEASEMLGLPHEVVAAGIDNAVEVGLVGRVSDD